MLRKNILLVTAGGFIFIGIFLLTQLRQDSLSILPDSELFVLNSEELISLVLPVGDDNEIEVYLQNNSRNNIRVIGYTGGGCGDNCCFHITSTSEYIIFPGECKALPVYVKIHRPAAFEVGLEVYISDPQLKSIHVDICGSGVNP